MPHSIFRSLRTGPGEMRKKSVPVAPRYDNLEIYLFISIFTGKTQIWQKKV